MKPSWSNLVNDSDASNLWCKLSKKTKKCRPNEKVSRMMTTREKIDCCVSCLFFLHFNNILPSLPFKEKLMRESEREKWYLFARRREENCEGRRATEKECVRVREKGSERCMNDAKVEKGERVRERGRVRWVSMNLIWKGGRDNENRESMEERESTTTSAMTMYECVRVRECVSEREKRERESWLREKQILNEKRES